MAQEIIVYRSPLEKLFYDSLFDPLFWQFMGGVLIFIIGWIIGRTIYTNYIKKRKTMRKR